MKKIILIIFFFYTYSFVSAQVEYPVFHNSKASFTNYLTNQLLTDWTVGKDICTKFLCSVVFEVDEEGNIPITSIQSSENTRNYPYIRNKIRDIVRLSAGFWKPMKKDGKVVKSDPILLLIYFNIERGCTEKDGWTSRNEDKLQNEISSLFHFSQDSLQSTPKNVIILEPANVYFSTDYSTDLNPIRREKKEN